MKWNFFTKLQLPPEPLTRGLPPPDPRFLCPLSSTEFIELPSPRTKFLGTPLVENKHATQVSQFSILKKYDPYPIIPTCLFWKGSLPVCSNAIHSPWQTSPTNYTTYMHMQMPPTLAK